MTDSILRACPRLLLTVALLALGQVTAGAERLPGVLVEAERYQKRVPDQEDFATPARELAASHRAVLARFFGGEYVVYGFELSQSTKYVGWLRYAANRSVSIKVAVDPGERPKFAKVPLPATGGLTGVGVWKWAKLFERDLAKGEHTLALGAAGMRPDCIFVSPSEEPPSDEMIREAPSAKLDPATRALLEKPVVAIRPDWLDGASAYRLPRWYDGCRVQAHTRFGASHMSLDVFFQAAAGFRQMGVQTFVRHIQSHTQGAWWPSSVGTIHPLVQDRNLAREIIDNAHRAGCRIIVYHAHMYNQDLAEEHPDWVCRDWRGKPLAHKRLAYLCYNSPFPDFYLTRALELADLGADGFYFDSVHMPKMGCWCQNCRRRFKEMTGLDHPRRADPEDPVWRKLVEFNKQVIETTFLKWRRALHERHPELVMLISSHLWSSMTDHHLNNRLFRIADSVKMEFSIPIRPGPNRVFAQDTGMVAPEADARLALGYTLARDAADGRPAHIWTHGLLDEASTLYATAGMVTHGCVANLDVPERTIPNSMFAKAFALGARISPYLAETRPVRWAAIHFAEQARDALAPDEIRQWQQVLYPICGAYQTLLRAHLPVGLVTDSQLEEGSLDGYQVLFLPAPGKLTVPMKAAVERFKATGGTVVDQQESWQWHVPQAGQQHAAKAFLNELAGASASVPSRVTGGPEKMHAGYFVHRDTGRLTIALTNDFSWVYTGRPPARKDVARLTKAPPPCQDVRILLQRHSQPAKVFDAVSGKRLNAKLSPDGLQIAVPDFEYLSLVVVEE